RGGRHAVSAQGLDPAHHEAGAGAERLAHEGVLAGGARLARGELGEAQRAQERQRGTQYPDHEGEPWAAESRGHDSGRAKDPGADGHPHDHGQPVGQPQRALEVGHTAGEWARKSAGAQRAAPLHDNPANSSLLRPAARPSAAVAAVPPPPPPPAPPAPVRRSGTRATVTTAWGAWSAHPFAPPTPPTAATAAPLGSGPPAVTFSVAPAPPLGLAHRGRGAIRTITAIAHL